MAEGLTFTIQNQAASAVGNGGGGLGSQGIASSASIKFDIWSDNGEGSDSTGLYIDGAVPQNVGSLDMTGSGIVLNNTHVYNAIVSYDGSNLELIVTDTTDPTKRDSHTWTGINLPSLVGGTSAWVGFTEPRAASRQPRTSRPGPGTSPSP